MAHAGPMSPVHPTDRLVGNSPALQALRAQIRHLAAFDTLGSAFVPTLLLQGETGTGKGLIARVIHDSGPRVQGTFTDARRAKTGQRKHTRAELVAALELYRAMDMTFWLPQAEAALAQVGAIE